jgi:hypothetical protein
MNSPVKMAEIARIRDEMRELCGDDDDLFMDMMEGESDIFAIASRIHEQIARDNEMLVGIKARIDTIKGREERVKNRASAGKAALGALMRAGGLTKLELPEVTYSVRLGKPGIEIVDPDAVPDEYCDFKRVPRKADINAAFDPSGELPNWLTRKEARDVVTGRTA